MFNKDSQTVKNCLLLIEKGLMKEEDIPDASNLREVVLNEINKEI